MPKTFVVSDTHDVFKGAWGPTSYGSRYSAYLAQYFESYITAWNAIVSPDDIVIHLGDVIWDSRKLPVFNHLNGTKHLVFGNHDASARTYVKYFASFQEFYEYEDIILTHKPVVPNTCSSKFYGWNVVDNKPKFIANFNPVNYIGNVHGHFHTTGFTQEFLLNGNSSRYYEVDTHLIHYGVYSTPMLLSDIQQQIRSQHYIERFFPTALCTLAA